MRTLSQSSTSGTYTCYYLIYVGIH